MKNEIANSKWFEQMDINHKYAMNKDIITNINLDSGY